MIFSSPKLSKASDFRGPMEENEQWEVTCLSMPVKKLWCFRVGILTISEIRPRSYDPLPQGRPREENGQWEVTCLSMPVKKLWGLGWDPDHFRDKTQGLRPPTPGQAHGGE